MFSVAQYGVHQCNEPRSSVERKDEYLETYVGMGASIGATTIICGNEIGEYAFIGAGSVVTGARARVCPHGWEPRYTDWMGV